MLNSGAEPKFHTFSASDENTIEEASYFSMKMINRGGRAKKLEQYMKLKAKDIESSNEESSSFYMIGILASINIAVFLFETASPVRNSEVGMLSLPMVYGAKINHLILLGEWWRLLTPMFLHSGVLHIALGCWMLLSFGPQVCKAYGSFPFFLIYVLGGISGNLISFLHTAEPTVGGTGPAFALIGAWFIYQVQNKDMPGKEASKSMIEKAIIATAISFVLSNFGPIDDWAHFGATLMGIAYGYLICPCPQVENIASSESGQKEGITLVKQYSDPYLGGNPSTSFMLIFALIGGVMGASSMLAGFFHLRKWTSHSLASAASSAIISWAITALAFGLVCKQIIMGGHRGKRLQTLEALITIAMVSQLLYILLLHAGIFRSRYGPVYGSYGPQH
ncbi:RHOMBOID-like protein 9, chloroplastic [Solanum verrucosum]|uniref:RHOMBOID-like protein 9, chloroplastic n=1 Tax=Solanum verrucosum TaxID=315347 RepID=UPI0020D18BF1|nr:RHOMBOID-like protein 9, chloroplastic [Solanum verrucosum]